MVRLAHISDVHVTLRTLGWTWRDVASKRLGSWVNFRLARRRRFRYADAVLARLMEELAGRAIDHIVFSGDATALGFPSEYVQAAGLLQVGIRPGLAIPGNHDYCTVAAARSGYFEQTFGPWQQGERLTDARYPFAQRVGPLWLVGVCAATGNRTPWDASGRVGSQQLERLQSLLASLAPGPRILIVHYPLCLPNGRLEGFAHGLRDLPALVRVAEEGQVCLWLHGHQHRAYHHAHPARASFPVICAGSATQTGLWTYGEYVIDGTRLSAVRRVYDPAVQGFVDAETFELQIPGA